VRLYLVYSRTTWLTNHVRGRLSPSRDKERQAQAAFHFGKHRPLPSATMAVDGATKLALDYETSDSLGRGKSSQKQEVDR
jgi:hypothetical protein